MSYSLLIEPDPILSRLYAQALAASGCPTQVVVSAQSAILAADECTPDVVICELQLVSHSGIEFLYEFRSYADWLKIPVIVLSMVPKTEFTASQRGLFEDLGIAFYAYKPDLSVKQLVGAVKMLQKAAHATT